MSADRNPDDALVKGILRRELVRAPSHQGGHSDEGLKISRILGVAFPLNMGSLSERAKELGFDPADLWPWYRQP